MGKQKLKNWAVNILLPFYILMRFLKAPLFNAPIPPFYRWKKNKESIILDIKFVAFLIFAFPTFYYLKFWIAICIFTVAFILKLLINHKENAKG